MNAATNSSCGTETGARPTPGFQPQRTSSSSVDVLDERREVLAAVLLRILQARQRSRAREADEDHLLVRRRQLPVRRAGRHVRAVARRRVRRAVAGRAREPGRAVAFGAALHVLRVRRGPRRTAAARRPGCGSSGSADAGARPSRSRTRRGRASLETRRARLSRSDARRRRRDRERAGRSPCRRHAVPPHASRSGSSRSRLPVAAKTALATAGAIGGVPGSPTPPDLLACSGRCGPRPPASRSCAAPGSRGSCSARRGPSFKRDLAVERGRQAEHDAGLASAPRTPAG